jgi:hypothetical protein
MYLAGTPADTILDAQSVVWQHVDRLPTCRVQAGHCSCMQAKSKEDKERVAALKAVAGDTGEAVGSGTKGKKPKKEKRPTIKSAYMVGCLGCAGCACMNAACACQQECNMKLLDLILFTIEC